MTNYEIKQILFERDVQYLYHANTVQTSLSFIENGGLLSRGVCEDKNLPQTPQNTDESDKKWGIFYDIFFDATDIQRITGINYYGGVLFVYDVNVLDTISEGDILITQSNPKFWTNNQPDYEKYFTNYEELNCNYNPDDFGQHITLKNQMKPLSFDYLKKIILSDPKRQNNILFEDAKQMIELKLYEKGLNIPLEIRDYNYNTRFINTYNDEEKLNRDYSIGLWSII